MAKATRSMFGYVFRQFADIVAILRIYGGDFENLYMVGDET
jgi:hypothetical protein